MKKILPAVFLIAFLLNGCRSSILDDPSTSIRFSIPQTSHVRLTVTNSYNTVLATLVDKVLQSGSYSVEYNPGGLTEGIYYFHLEATSMNGTVVFSDTVSKLVIK